MDTLTELESTLSAWWEARAEIRAEDAAGKDTQGGWVALAKRFPAFAHTDSSSAVREAARSKRTLESMRPLWTALAPELDLAVVEAAAASSLEALDSASRTTEVALGSEIFLLRQADALQFTEPTQARRASLFRAASEARLELRGHYARALETQALAAQRLEAGSAQVWRQGFRPDAAKDAVRVSATNFLKQTEDAYRELLGYVLKQLEPTLRPLPEGSATFADVLRAGTTPWLNRHLPPDRAISETQTWLSRWEFHPTANGRLRVLEAESDAALALCISPVRVPGLIRLGLRSNAGGVEGFFRVLAGYGEAMRWAHMAADAPVEARLLGDATVAQAHGLAWSLLLTSETWYRLERGATRAQAKEVARAGAWALLAKVRAACAIRILQEDVETSGLSMDRTQALADSLTDALRVRVHPGEALNQLGQPLRADDPCVAWDVGEALHAQLEGTLNEDFFRNPAARRWLQTQWQAARPDATRDVLAVSGRTGFALEPLGARLVRVLGA